MNLLPRKAQSLQSSWTIETLREHLLALIEANEVKYSERFEASQSAINAAFLAQQTAMQTALTAQKIAVDKAETSTEKRFESVNEFRQTLADLQQLFIQRVEVMGLLKGVDDKLLYMQQSFDARMETQRISIEKNADSTIRSFADARLTMTHFLTMDAYETRHNELQRQVNELRELSSKAGGQKAGTQSTMGNFIAIGALIISFFSIVMVVILHFI